MDWTQIIIAAVGIIGGIDLGRILFFGANKKKATAEAAGAEHANVDAEVETLRKAMDTLNKQLERSHETIAAQSKSLDEKSAEIGRLKATITALFDDMCVHKGCRLRKPHQGQGQLWYEKYREDPALGADYLSVDTLIKQDRDARNAGNLKQEDAE